jgi:ATP-binding cassette subfamily F protein uup
MLADYSGTVILVSHDRDFLDRVVTSVILSEGDGLWAEYAGGYSDMIAQQGPGIAGKRAGKPGRGAPRPGAPVVPPSGPSKFSFRDRDALAKLSGRIEALQSRIAAHRTQLADPDLYRRDPAKFQAVTGALAADQTELAAAEEQWLALEMRREALEG